MARVVHVRFARCAFCSVIGVIWWADGVPLGDQLRRVTFVQPNRGFIDHTVVAVVAFRSFRRR